MAHFFLKKKGEVTNDLNFLCCDLEKKNCDLFLKRDRQTNLKHKSLAAAQHATRAGSTNYIVNKVTSP